MKVKDMARMLEEEDQEAELEVEVHSGSEDDERGKTLVIIDRNKKEKRICIWEI